MAFRGGSVHIPCAFSIVEILSSLYSGAMKYDPKDPEAESRDRLILSKGHGVMALYSCFRQLGWLPADSLDGYFSEGSLLHGLCSPHISGLEVCSGSLGHGLPIAAGVALGLKIRGQINQKVYCIVGDGEMNEGPMWEAMLFASHHQLHNLVIIVDANGYQAMGTTTEVMNLEPFADKFRSFGFEAYDINGHDLPLLNATFAGLGKAQADALKPKGIVARTIKGKGVTFMEGKNEWHYGRLTEEIYGQAMAEVRGSQNA